MEGVQFPMVLANYVRVKLVEPLKEQLRAEGREQGREQGIEQGREQGREQGIEQGREQGITQANAVWREWYERRLKAEAEGLPFDEPPPDVG